MDNTTAIIMLNQTIQDSVDILQGMFNFGFGFIIVLIAFHGIMKYG